MKKVLSLVLSLVMLLSLVVPVSAEDTIFEGNGTLKDKTVAFTIEADKTTLYGEGEQIVKFHIYAESVDNVPIRAFQFTLEPSANLTLATELAENSSFSYGYMNTDTLIKSTTNMDGMYSRFEYTPASRYFAAAGSDDGQGITAKTEIMTIMGKVNGTGTYTLSMTGVVAGNGDAPDSVTQKFTSTVAGATVTVKSESERPQPNLSLALSASKVNVGDTFTATLTNKEMSIISFISKIRFNKDVLEVVSITEGEGYTNLVSGAVVKVKPTVDEANANGVVGISIAKTVETTYPAKNIVTVTFKAKAVGDGWFELYESTDGPDGYHGDASGGAVTVEKTGEQNPLVMRVVPQSNTVCPKAANATVKFDVVIEKNPGIFILALDIDYPAELELREIVKVADGTVTANVAQKTVVWENLDTASNYTETGVLLTLEFGFKADGLTGKQLSVAVAPQDGDLSNIIDCDGKAIALELMTDKLTVAHTYEEYVPTEADTPVIPATCTTKATYCKRCVCGEESTETFEYGQLTGHDFREVSVVPATDTVAGVVTSVCSRCDETKTEEFAFADAAVRLTVGTADGTAKIHRGTIDVPVAIAADKAIDSAEFAVAYDKTRLVLTGVSDGWTLTGDTVKTTTKLESGAQVVLTFAVKVGTDGKSVNSGDATISVSSVKLCNGDTVLTVGQVSGKVVITMAADLNGDGRINAADLLLMRKVIAKMSPVIVEGSADLNADGRQNAADLLLMRKVIAKMSPEIY